MAVCHPNDSPSGLEGGALNTKFVPNYQMSPNKAFQPTPSRAGALGFPRSLRSLGAAERRRWASQ